MAQRFKSKKERQGESWSLKRFGAFLASLLLGFVLGSQYTLAKTAHLWVTLASQNFLLLDTPLSECDTTTGGKKTEVTGSSSPSCGNDGDDNNKNKELGFLHIPKTGGSAIENAAKHQAQKHWGYFAWDDRTKQSDWNNYMSEKYKELYGAGWHHIPPSDLTALTNLSLAYQGQDLFAVIRNPFTRVVSEVIYRCQVAYSPKEQHLCLDKKYANSQIRQRLTKVLEAEASLEASMKINQNHFMPQWYFFYNRFTLERQTRYLLHFENLAEDFSDLMEAFSLNITLKTSLPAHLNTRRTNYKEVDRHLFHSVEDLDKTTQRMIVKLYRMDFELGGYSLNASDTTSFSPLPNVSANGGSKFWELPYQMPQAKNALNHPGI